MRQVIGEAAPDDFSAKEYLLSLPREFSTYRVHISADPMAWGGVTFEQADRAAHRLAEMCKDQFPGIETVISMSPNTFPQGGESAEVLEQIDNWLSDNSLEALQGG